MDDTVRIELQPLGKTLVVPRGAPLQDVLYGFGIEFPCGGHGRCKRCRIQVRSGAMPPTKDERDILDAQELAEGWRLACRNRAVDDLVLEIRQWEAAILADESVFEFVPREGLGVAIDLGTTTLAAQLLDLRNGSVLSVQTGLNPQAGYGSDIMSRIHYGIEPAGQAKLRDLIRDGLSKLVVSLCEAAGRPGAAIATITVVGNTVMHHFFCDVPILPLAHYPFEPSDDGLRSFDAAALGWDVPGNPRVHFLPCLGGFVGSDILAGIMATRMDQTEALQLLVDLGTNGEVVVGNRDRMLCASTAAGPAFEGARIRMGMQAATGAISEVLPVPGGKLRVRVLGSATPRGICGSGLVDAVAAGLELGAIRPDGRFSGSDREWPLAGPVTLAQTDIRELQLAKGAIAAAVRILIREWGAGPEDVSHVYLAGAFGNYINRASARRIGLIDFPEEKVVPAGNTALLGAKMALFSPGTDFAGLEGLRERIRHVGLAADPEFEETYIESMLFPA